MHMCLPHVHKRPRSPEEGGRSLGGGAAGGCEPPTMGTGTESSFSGRAVRVITAEHIF